MELEIAITITIITALIGIIGFFVKRAFDRLDGKADKIELDELNKKIMSSEETIAKIKDNYLTKEDYFREQAKVDKKLDEIMKILMELSRSDRP